MKKILDFMDRHLGYLLIIPALIFIILFSIWPIVESTKFSFFDFQLNDQQKSGLYFSDRYNLDLMKETYEYIDYYLALEMDSVELSETKAAIESASDSISEDYSKIRALFDVETGVIEIDKTTEETIESISKHSLDELNRLYAIEDVFSIQEDMFLVASELETAIVKPNFIGMENFRRVVRDPRVIQATQVTLFFTSISVALELAFGLALALIMNKAMKGRGLIRTFSLIPWAIPTSVAALMWAYLYNGSSGIVALVLERFGIIAESTDIMMTATGSLWAIIFADVWKTTPYMALLLLAGLQVIPISLYESSALDGANKWQQFRHITLPLLKPSILVALLFRTLDAFRVFDLIWVLTGGGPGGSTESISIYAYKTMFAQTRFGYGAATVLIMALIVGVISYLYIKFLDVQLVSD